ncbi:MAG TPA: GNAT family N-acetyltransferase, partial [Hellea balneolensis]|nr:GNAT family N-acetyltransferase [Hellea balneolensis]
KAGFLPRTDRQFHFFNRGYKDFDDFLVSLTSRKRKKIKSERKRVREEVQIKRLRGDDLKAHHWDRFYEFYQNTSLRKWGQAYLTRDFFDQIHAHMREQVLLVLAYQDDRPIAGALNFIGGDALYGRHWGALTHIPFLHFELCYYQAIEAALEWGLGRVEAGAQGEHKLARGYEPVLTRSAHYLVHPGLREAVGRALQRERDLVNQHVDILQTHAPFRKGN